MNVTQTIKDDISDTVNYMQVEILLLLLPLCLPTLAPGLGVRHIAQPSLTTNPS